MTTRHSLLTTSVALRGGPLLCALLLSGCMCCPFDPWRTGSSSGGTGSTTGRASSVGAASTGGRGSGGTSATTSAGGISTGGTTAATGTTTTGGRSGSSSGGRTTASSTGSSGTTASGSAGSSGGTTGFASPSDGCRSLFGDLDLRLEACGLQASASFSTSLCGPLVDGISAGRAGYDADAARSCVARLTGASCEEVVAFTRALFTTCPEAFPARVADGGACRLNAECRDGRRCALPATTCGDGSCLARLADGEGCLRDDDCLPLHLCSPGPSGPRCVAPNPDPGLPVDAGCSSPPARCAPGLRCALGTGRCSTVLPPGAPCLEGDDLCIRGTVCRGGSCGLPRDGGDPCAHPRPDGTGAEAPCPNGSWCPALLPDAGPAPRCLPAAPLDGGCVGPDGCLSGRCVAGQCRESCP